MSFKILSNTENKLLGRKEISAEVEFQGATPSKAEMIKVITTKTGADEKLVVIKKITTKYGSQKAVVVAEAYHSDEAMKKLYKEKKAEENKEKTSNAKEGGK